MPFIFVQLSAFDAKPPAHGGDWPALRQAQSRVSQTVPRTAMVVSIDAGERHNIHPRRKKCIGERLALAALSVAYGQPIRWRAPCPIAARCGPKHIDIVFENNGQKLTTYDGKPPRGFEIVGNNQVVPAAARLHDTVVQLLHAGFSSAVRYAWAAWTDANLCDTSGLPVAPFELVPADSDKPELRRLA